MKKVAIVTGASRGIGRAVAKRLGRDGFVVVVNYLSNAAEADQVVAEVKGGGGNAVAIQADVSSAPDVERLFNETVKKLGSVDVVVHNSGIMPLSPIGKNELDLFDEVISTNLRGAFLVLAQGFLGTAMDITEQELLTRELKLRQAHLTEAQKLTHTGSWVWRVADRKKVHLSEEWYRIYGFDPVEEAPAWEKLLARVHPEDRLKWKGTIERAIVEKADYDMEFRILFPNGMVKWIHTVGHPVLSDAGDLEQFVGSSTDITERKSAEQEREKLRQEGL